jgi:site-specific DNA-methyltransferase (adenine-specific)
MKKEYKGRANINIYNCDNMEFMKGLPDNYYDLAIVDPPYGIGEGSEKIHSRHKSQLKYTAKNWDNNTPNKYYFAELFRVSKNQIIWGANHFIESINKNSSCWLFWDKDGYGDFADGELAWASFKTAVRKYKFTWNGFRKQMPQERIHPTEKPYNLYKWILENYAKQGDKILDTHGGSMSIAVACWDYGFDLDLCELDKEYFDKGVERFENHIKQQKLF